jgi:hypothetical protein
MQRIGAFCFPSCFVAIYLVLQIGEHSMLLFINRVLWRSGALVFLVSAIRQFTFRVFGELSVFNKPYC